MKNKVMWVVIGWVLVAGGVWTVSAYSTNIWSPIQYVKQLFVTPNGEFNSTKASIKLNWATGRIDAKSMYVNWQEVATKWNAWMFKKNGTNAYYNNWNVWIWIINPKAKLDVSGDMNVSIDKKLNWDSRTWYNYYDYTQIASFSNKATPLSDRDPRVLSIAQDKDWSAVIRWVWRNIRLQAQAWTLSIDWNVWIWTTNPQAKLDVNGDVKLKWDLDITNTTNNKWYPAIRNNWKWVLWIDEKKKEISIWSTYGPDEQNVIIHSINGVNTLAAVNWNVWIWIINPKAKLDVNGQISVRGGDAKIIANPDQSYWWRADLIGTYNWWDNKAVYIAWYNIKNAHPGAPSKVTNVRFWAQTLMKVDFANNKIVMNAPVYKTSCPSWMYKYWNVCIDATHSATTANRNTAVVNCSNAGKQLCSIADVTVAMNGWLNNFTNEWLLDFSKNDYYAYIDHTYDWQNPEGVDGPNRSKYRYYRCCVHLNP